MLADQPPRRDQDQGAKSRQRTKQEQKRIFRRGRSLTTDIVRAERCQTAKSRTGLLLDSSPRFAGLLARRIKIFLPALLILSGCVATTTDVDRLQESLNSVQKGQADLIVKIDQLDTSLTSLREKLDQSQKKMTTLNQKLH